MSYLDPDYIKDRQVRTLIDHTSDYDISGYLDEADEELNVVGIENNITSPSDLFDLDDNGYHNDYIVRQFLISFVCMRTFEDRIGINNSVVQDDKYMVKYEMYKKRMTEYRNKITYPVLTGQEDSRDDFVRTACIFRA